MEWIRFGLVAALIAGALVMVFLAITGVFRFQFVLNRMHMASLIDTGAMLLLTAAVIIARGFSAADWKLLLILLLLWIGSPISSHMLAQLEVMTDNELEEHLIVEEDEGGSDK